jgi:hypothetical protein
MSSPMEPQVGELRPLFWPHLSTNNDGQSRILQSHVPALSSLDRESVTSTSSTITDTGSSHRSFSSTNSTGSTESSEPPSPLPVPRQAIRVQIHMASKPRPVLRRCSTPITTSLREIRQRQSEEDLRQVYEAQTLAYLNDTIQF